MTDTHRYPAHVFWSENDKGFIAVAPDLPVAARHLQRRNKRRSMNCRTPSTPGWRLHAAARNPIPAPSAPATDHQHSGKVLLRMPRRLHAQLAQSAKQEDVSLNQYIVYVLSSAVSSRGSEQPTVPKRSTSSVA